MKMTLRPMATHAGVAALRPQGELVPLADEQRRLELAAGGWV
jgi:hypothetical protein